MSPDKLSVTGDNCALNTVKLPLVKSHTGFVTCETL